MGLMSGKRGLVLGVANDKSIAWGVAQQLHEQGAELAFTYVNASLEKRVRPLAESLDATLILPCDVTSDASLDDAFAQVEQTWPEGIDFIIHSVAYAQRDDLRRPISETSREGFSLALDISAYSLLAVAQRGKRQLCSGGSILTMTYLGSQRAVPHYNVMGVAKAALEAEVCYLATELGEQGVRVNAISAGPIKTLAASGVGDIKKLLNHVDANAPLQRCVDQQDVGKSALYLVSDLASGVTGEVHYVDGGYSQVLAVERQS